MKRLVVCSCLVAVFAVPAVVVAAVRFPPHNNEYQGRVEGDPNTYFGFNLNRHKQQVRHVAMAIPMRCYSGESEMVRVALHHPLELESLPSPVRAGRHHRHHRHRPFAALAYGTVPIQTDLGQGTADVLAILTNRRRATGYVQAKTRDDSQGRCYSGALQWTLRRGAHVTLPPPAP